MRCEYLCNWMYFFIPLGMVATNVTMKAFLGVAGYCALSGGGHRHMQWCRGRKNIWRSCDSHYQDTSKTISRIKNYLLFSVYLSFSDKDTMLSNTVVAAPMAFKKKTCRQEMDQVLIMPCFYGGFGFWLPQSMRTIHVRSYMLISHHGSLQKNVYIYIYIALVCWWYAKVCKHRLEFLVLPSKPQLVAGSLSRCHGELWGLQPAA